MSSSIPPAVPLFAELITGTKELVVTMSRVVHNGGTAFNAFQISGNSSTNGQRASESTNTTGPSDTVSTGQTGSSGADAIGTCSYDGTAASFLDDLDRLVPAWTDFPMTDV